MKASLMEFQGGQGKARIRENRNGAVALLPLGRLVFDLFSSFGLFLERAVFRRILLNLFILNCFAS